MLGVDDGGNQSSQLLETILLYRTKPEHSQDARRRGARRSPRASCPGVLLLTAPDRPAHLCSDVSCCTCPTAGHRAAWPRHLGILKSESSTGRLCRVSGAGAGTMRLAMSWAKRSRARQPLPLVASDSVPTVPWAPGAKGSCRGQGPESWRPVLCTQGDKGLPRCPEPVWRRKAFMQVSKEMTQMLLPWTPLLPSIVHHPSTERRRGAVGGCWRGKPRELDLSQDGKVH